jgi:translation elongation factor EF-4
MRKNKSELPDEIVDNLMKIHSIHNDKYAPIGNAICDSWYDYYSELVKWIVKFTNGY